MSESTGNSKQNQEVKKERKFHDAWAFILFVIFTVGMNTFYFLKTSSVVERVKTLSDQNKFASCFFSNLGFTIALVLAGLLLCFFIPKVLIVLSVLAIPALSVYGYFALDIGKNPNGGAISMILFIVNLIFIIIAGVIILSQLDYIAASLSIASQIFFTNFIGVLFLQITCLFLLVLSLVPVSLVDSTDKVVQAMRYVIILQVFWLGTILYYFMQVIISSVVHFQIKEKEKSVFMNSVENSCYALGSISFGALLIAIIATLQVMISNARAQERRNEQHNIFTSIMLALASAFIEILGDIVKCANAIAYPYLSVNGTGYKESVVQSFQLVTSAGYEKVAAYMGLDFVIGTAFIGAACAIYLFNTQFLFTKLSVSVSGNDAIFYGLFYTLIFALFFDLVFSLLKSAVMALIFEAATSHSEVKEYAPEFIDILDEEKKKNLPTQPDQSAGQPQAARQ